MTVRINCQQGTLFSDFLHTQYSADRLLTLGQLHFPYSIFENTSCQRSVIQKVGLNSRIFSLKNGGKSIEMYTLFILLHSFALSLDFIAAFLVD